MASLLQRLLAERDKESDEDSALRDIVRATLLSPEFTHAHGLAGVRVADLVRFDITEDFAYGPAADLAHLQMGPTDILHVLAAHHLRCEFIASFDNDFRRLKATIEEQFRLTVLTTPQEVLRVVATGK